ncbi:MAG: SsrA-binding protein SmpB [Acidimicrobiia bacterium]|nr:SsrA-binding protein SmpB [Acidimicrobiia bacterium]
MAGKDKKPDSRSRVIATNRLARRDYDILDELECGIVLRGSEVKSLREARVRLGEAFARVVRDELWLISLHIPPYAHGVGFGAHDPDRQRKLLAHRHEVERWGSLAEQQRLTMVALSMYFKEGRVKVQLGLARGRKHYDKRQVLARRDADLEARRAIVAASKGRAR